MSLPSLKVTLCFICLFVLKWSHLGVQKTLGNAQTGLLKWFNSKFPTSIPAPFIWEVPPVPRAQFYAEQKKTILKLM